MPEPTGLTDMLASFLPKGGQILDVGCGDGALVGWLRQNGYDAQGIDPQADGNGILRGGAEALPVAAASVDCVLFVNSLHHVPVDEMDRAIGEAARVLRPGGRLVVMEPLAEGDWFDLLLPVQDETAIRAAAMGVLERAGVAGFVSLASRRFTTEYPAENVDAVLHGFLAVDPARAKAVQNAHAAVARSFATLGRPLTHGKAFLQPMRVDVLDLPDDPSIVRFARDAKEIEAALKIRCVVFCEEQGVSLPGEIDGLDDQCLHLVATIGGRVVGTSRIRAYGENGLIGKIERVALIKDARGLGLGERLVRFASQALEARGHRSLLLNAQTVATGFYERLGYRAEGEVFDDEGIPHVAMWRRSSAG